MYEKTKRVLYRQTGDVSFQKGDEMEECKIKNCAEKIYKNGLCEKHYQELMVEAGANTANKKAEKAVGADIDLKASVGIQLEAFLLRTARSAGRLVSTYKNITQLGVGDAGDLYLKKVFDF